jgi:hypothetical protein
VTDRPQLAGVVLDRVDQAVSDQMDLVLVVMVIVHNNRLAEEIIVVRVLKAEDHKVVAGLGRMLLHSITRLQPYWVISLIRSSSKYP